MAHHGSDSDVRNSFLNPPNYGIARQNSNSDEILGGSIYDPAYYSSLFANPHDEAYTSQGDRQIIGNDGGSTSATGASQVESCSSRSFHLIDAD